MRRMGITLLEILIAVSILVIIMAIWVFTLNPAGQLTKARNKQRSFHLNSIMIAIQQNVAENRLGRFLCEMSGDIPTSTTRMKSGSGGYDIAPCLVIPSMPFDPSDGDAYYDSVSSYDSGYDIVQNASSGEVTVSAPSAELGEEVSVTR